MNLQSRKMSTFPDDILYSPGVAARELVRRAPQLNAERLRLALVVDEGSEPSHGQAAAAGHKLQQARALLVVELTHDLGLEEEGEGMEEEEEEKKAVR